MKRLEERERFAAPGIVFALLIAAIASPVAAQSQQARPVTISQAVFEACDLSRGDGR